MIKLCTKNPAKCTAAVLLAGYTAVNLGENSLAQQACISECLPPNWPAVVESNSSIVPEYFVDNPNPETQPQCTEGIDCETYCVATCQANHPTTVLGAALEGAGEIIDDLFLPFVEDVLGIPISEMGAGVMVGIRIAAIVMGLIVVYKVGSFMNLWKKKRPSRHPVARYPPPPVGTYGTYPPPPVGTYGTYPPPPVGIYPPPRAVPVGIYPPAPIGTYPPPPVGTYPPPRPAP